MRNTFAHYDRQDLRRASFATMDLFRRPALETAERSGLSYPTDAADGATALVREILLETDVR